VANQPGNTVKPDPDPTVLTTQALLREIGAVKELFDAQQTAVEKTIEDIHDNILRIANQHLIDMRHLESLIDEKFQTIRSKFEEKFASIDKQFLDRDTRVEQMAKASAEALSAALQAAKEAVGEQNKSSALSINKSEVATGKQIDQLGETVKQNATVFNDKLDDIKKRMDRNEGVGEGSVQERGVRRQQSNTVANWGGLIAGVILALIAAATFILSHIH
jgi:hypothetical protein